MNNLEADVKVSANGSLMLLSPLPSVDRTLHVIVTDLEERGLLDRTLILMMGEFGRSTTIRSSHGE